MSKDGKFLVGSVLERRTNGHTPLFKPANVGSHGFPPVQHRSKSAFAQSRDAARKSSLTTGTRQKHPPTVAHSRSILPNSVKPGAEDWRDQMSRENESRVANMTDEEREKEKEEILERFGAGIGDVLRRAKQVREKEAEKERWPAHGSKLPLPQSDVESEISFKNLEEVPISEEEPVPSRSSERGFSPPPALSRPNSRPASRAGRKLRFAELGPKDVYVYESAPPSPRRKPLALPPPADDGTAISLGQWHGKMVPITDQQLPLPPPQRPDFPTQETKGLGEAEEGTAEYIRRRYFPDAPPNDPNLAWMQGNTRHADQFSTSLRFDLHGNVVPLAIATQLPTHLGLHHHAEGSTAGYTLDDIFLLSRSTVPAQRATMLGVLASIVLNLSKAVRGGSPGLESVVSKSEDIRKRIMAAGVEAMHERGSVGARAIEVVWASVVGWDAGAMDLEGIELQQDSDAAIASLPLDPFLSQVSTLFSQGDATPGSLMQLLSILHRLARQSNEIAESIVRTPNLLKNVFQNFLLTPIPPADNGSLPEPAALEFLICLASASRTNADTLVEPTDALLRFVAVLPSSSPFPLLLATNLLTLTLQLYATLAKYGFYSHIATTAMEQFSQLNQYILSPACTSSKLKLAWLDLMNAWIVSAINPHKTTPEHDILWSQVVGWGWKDEIAELSKSIGDGRDDIQLWGAVWKAQAQFLGGSNINGIKGGEAERSEFVTIVKDQFHGGVMGKVVTAVIDALQQDLGPAIISADLANVACHADVLGSVIRLWLACLPPHLKGSPVSPPFELPFPRISETCAKLVTHPLWDSVWGSVDTRNYVYSRQLSGFLGAYLALSRRLPGIPENLWVAQAFSILLRSLPGDEYASSVAVEEMMGLLTPEWFNQRHTMSPMDIWEKGGLSILRPFFAYTICPDTGTRISPLQATPISIATSSTLRLPMISRRRKFGLPLARDWILAPMNHLLRSADSEVLKILPSGWDSSEVEVTRATLFFSCFSRDILAEFSLDRFALSREEAIFGCMRVFMLEHGQPQNDSSEEIFRDPVVEKLMNQVLETYSYRITTSDPAKAPQTTMVGPTLEQVAARFLGASMPFFQFYTDLVALYDAISFSNITFSKLLLPPTSMRYAIDYRKYLWDDFSHLLKTICVPCEQVLSADLKEHLYPVESDPHLIGAYLRALLKDSLQGFVRLIAVHHIASSIWPDLRGEEASGETRARKLIGAIAVQGSVEVVREVATYYQISSGPIWVPPGCFEHAGNVAKVRMQWVKGVGDEMVSSRLEGLLK